MAIPLYINTADADSISNVIREAVDKVSHAFDLSEEIAVPNAVSPHLIGKALKQFLDILYRAESDQKLIANGGAVSVHQPYIEDAHYEPLSRDEISEVGNHGLQLLGTLSEWAQALELPYQKNQINAIMVMVALWIARRGGELSSIESVVNTLADIANSTTEPDALAELSYMMGELISAVSLETRFDFENSNHQHPWRVLNLNRGIIATRSHDTGLMEHAFEELIRNVPEDAEQFFKQGMQQMEALDYPDHVRAVMTRYFQQSKTRVLH
ncbi:MAG: hypothetical protein L0Z73_05195 [Gammaproteobacteria bacterium]|nr:hypothetical protein [Gammaproteobacteria bacterium]